MHILIAWEQGRGLGHLTLILPLARRLRAGGHKVTLATRDLANVWTVPDIPFTHVLPAPVAVVDHHQEHTRTFSDIIRAGGFSQPAQLKAITRSWLDIFALLKPDAVLCEHAFNAVFAAQLYGLPVARIGYGFTVPPVQTPMPPVRHWQPHTAQERAQSDAALLHVMNAVLGDFDKPAMDSVAALFGAGEEFVMTWPELDHMGPQQGRHYYGPLGQLGGIAAPHWPSAGGRTPGQSLAQAPKIFVYLPPEHPQEDVLLEALDQFGGRVIWFRSAAVAQACPPHIHFVNTPLDMAATLAEADLVITHGGQGMAIDAVRYGCPMLVLPNVFERAMLAAQLVKAQLAVVPRHSPVTAQALAALIDQAITKGCAATKGLQQRYKAYDAGAAAQELADDVLSALLDSSAGP